MTSASWAFFGDFWRRRRLSANPSMLLDKDISKLEQLLAIAPGLLCLHDDKGVLQYVSAGVHDLIGIGPDKIVGKRLDDFIHPDDRLAALERWGRLMAGDAVPQSEFRLIRPDGVIIWVEAEFSLLIDRGFSRSSVKFGSTIRDVTRRRLAESDLRKIRDDLASGIAAGQGALYRLVRGPSGKWYPVFFASNIERVTGYKVDDAMTVGWIEGVLSLPNRSIRQSAQLKAIDQGEATAEYDFPMRTGSLIRIRDHIRRWDRFDGAMELVGYIVDITDSYYAERKLADTREELAAIVASSPGILYRYIVNPDGEWENLFISETAVRIFGLPHGNVEIAEWRAWAQKNVDPAGQAALNQALHIVLREGKYTLEYRFRAPDGRWRWARDNARSVSKSDDKFEVVGYTIDITEEKELANQLAQAGKLATLGQMAAGMAHELSQPLAGISMAAENALLALQNPTFDPAQIEKKLGRISEQALRAAKLIDHMRTFGRRDPGEAMPIEIGPALDGALLIAQGRLRSTKAFVKCRVQVNLPPVRGSAVLLEQVLLNLIANACDAYMEARPPIPDELRSVKIAVRESDASVSIIIADQAGGIPGSDINRIFEPFFTTKPAGKGTGLGLSISYGIVSDMGGVISVRNGDGGAIFEITLPKFIDRNITAEPRAVSG